MQNNVKPKFINAYTHHKMYALRHLYIMLMWKLIRFIWVENIEKKEDEDIQFLFKKCFVIAFSTWPWILGRPNKDKTRAYVHFGSKHGVLQNIFSSSWSTSQEYRRYKFRYPFFFYQQYWTPPNPFKIFIIKVLNLN